MTEANYKQGDWPDFVTPHFTTGSAPSARVFRRKVSAKREARFRWERGRAGSPAGQPRWGARLVRIERVARILVNPEDLERLAGLCGRDVRAPSTVTKNAAGVSSRGVFGGERHAPGLRSSSVLPVKFCPQPTEI